MTNCFVFDINKCVGCHACMVACSIENNTNPPMNWREVFSLNSLHHPDLPLYYFSLACNHCDDPLCLKSCPAKAYYKDEKTNAIIHEEEKCFGCKYCTWACPYDAPKFNSSTKLIEKCTFCNSRLTDDLKPACANLCPTGALDFKAAEKEENNKIDGFPNKNIGPNILFVPQRKTQGPTIAVSQTSITKQKLLKKYQERLQKKIEIKKEWVLVIFTLIVAFLSSWFSASVINSNITVDPIIFASLGVVSLILSSLHLGKKLRAYRSIFNLKTSWLSREIFFYSFFLAFAIIALFFEQYKVIISMAIITGVCALISVDRLYKYTEYYRISGLHSALVTLTALLLFAAFTELTFVFTIIIIAKLFLYIGRKKITITTNSYGNLIVTFLRVIVGILLPVYLYFFDFQNHVIILFLITGEVIDRIEFYIEMDVTTPQKQLFKQLNSEM